MLRTRYILSFLSVFIMLNACKTAADKSENYSSNNETTTTQKEPNNTIPEVLADMETQPVSSEDDAADDPAIWVHPKNKDESIIIGTNKKKGLAVYDLSGKQLSFYPVGKINNVDVRYDFPLSTKKVDIVAGSNRTNNSVGVWIINPKTRNLEEVLAHDLISKVEEVYGFCLYKSAKNHKVYAFIVSKAGQIEQWELFDNGKGQVDGKIVRSFSVKTQAEGLVADDELGILYVAEENTGIWKFEAEPNGTTEGKMVTDLSNTQLEADLEGVTIYYAANKKGYLIASSQGNNSYAVFERQGTNKYLGSFKIGNSDTIDGTSDTDGIDVVSFGLGEKYPQGFFIAQDGTNDEQTGQANQNFKVVAWEKVVKSLENKLVIDNQQNPRK